MKQLYNIQLRKDDGTLWGPKGILAQDVTANNVTTRAAVNALNEAFTQAGAGNWMTQYCNLSGTIDYDTTA